MGAEGQQAGLVCLLVPSDFSMGESEQASLGRRLCGKSQVGGEDGCEGAALVGREKAWSQGDIWHQGY